MGRHSDEIKCQYECFRILCRDDPTKIESLMADIELARTFRRVIDLVEIHYGRIPEPEELIFIACRLLHRSEL